jgi:hypothetical protein
MHLLDVVWNLDSWCRNKVEIPASHRTEHIIEPSRYHSMRTFSQSDKAAEYLCKKQCKSDVEITPAELGSTSEMSLFL